MDVDLSRLPAGTSGWLALADHALALGDLAEVDYLELKGALPFGERRDRKRSAVVISRAVLGMSNRMPELASKHLGGAGVVLVGIDQGNVVGVEPVDGAVLRDAVAPYVGDDGPQWDYQFINHREGLILAVIVDPPRWGDNIHACRKDYADDATNLAVRDGDVFVRLPGKTRPATSYDIAQLQRRRLKAPHTGAQLSLSYAGRFDRTSRVNVRELVEGVVDSIAEDLLDSLPEQAPRYPTGSGFQSLVKDYSGWTDPRAHDRFRNEVQEWQEKSYAASEEIVTEFLRHTLEHGACSIENESDRYLEGVRVRVTLPPSVTALIASDTDYCDHGGQFRIGQMLPDRPSRYEDVSPLALRNFASASASASASRFNAITPSTSDPTIDVEPGAGGQVISWYVGDLPPRGRVTTAEEFTLFTDESLHDHAAQADVHTCMSVEIRAAWQVTARAIDYVFDGELALACRQEPGAVLMWRSGR